MGLTTERMLSVFCQGIACPVRESWEEMVFIQLYFALLIIFTFFPGKTCSVIKLSVVTVTISTSCSMSTQLPVWADSSCPPRNGVMSWSKQARLQGQPCAWPAGSPKVSGCHDITFLPCFITFRLILLLFFQLLIRFPDNNCTYYVCPYYSID